MAQKIKYTKTKTTTKRYRRKKKRKQAIDILVYIAHKHGGKAENIERAKQITHDLQVNDLENSYICPLLLFSHLRYGEIGYDAEMELCLDILSACDKLIVASDFIESKGVKKEIDFANLVGMEVVYLEDSE